MKENHDEVCALIYEAMWRAFNRSMSALDDAGAIDRTELNEKYKGVGSKYYDLVTEQFDLTLDEVKPRVSEIIQNIKG